MSNLLKHIIFGFLVISIIAGCQRKFHEQLATDPIKVDTVQVFNDYDFNSGEYELFGVYWSDFQRNSLADSIGTFSIKDTVLLNKLKNNWKLESHPHYECGYDYKLYLAKGDSIVSISFVNILCESIVIDDVGYRLERDKIASLYGETDSIAHVRVVFYGQDLAIEYVEGMRADKNVFVVDNGGYVWEKYVGYFEVTYTNTKLRDRKKALVEVEKAITKKYKTTDFELENIGSNSETGTYKVRIYCHKAFADEFDLYPIRKEYTYIINYSMMGFQRR
ncbi:MAG: hypothetical protein GQ574_12215 [Crocinitomix sp.]|nr:hypothetical protein [Crocinitomix sp.]